MLFSRSVLLTLVLVCMSQGLNSNVFDEQVEALVEWQNVFRADLLWCGIMNAAPYPKVSAGCECVNESVISAHWPVSCHHILRWNRQTNAYYSR